MIHLILLIAATGASFAADVPQPQRQPQLQAQYDETLEEAYATIGVPHEAEQEKVDAAISEMKRRLQEERKNALKEKNPSLLLQAQTKLARFNLIETVLKNPEMKAKLDQWLQAIASATAYRTGKIPAPDFAQKLKIKNTLAEKAKNCTKTLTAPFRRHYGKLIAAAVVGTIGYAIEYNVTHPNPIMLNPNAVFIEGTSALAPRSSIRAASPKLANGVELTNSDLAKCVTPESGLGALVQQANAKATFVINYNNLRVSRGELGTLFFSDPNTWNPEIPTEAKKIIAVSKGIVFQAPDEKWYFHPIGSQN